MKNTACCYLLALTLSIFSGAALSAERSHVLVPKAQTPPIIDGEGNEAAWKQAKWQHIEHVLIGPEPSKEDFSGRFKLVWDKDHLYLLAEIVDDVMADVYANPLEHYWDDETLEIFIDEDASGGNHQYNHSAFAYHIALDNQVVDSGPDKKPHLYNDHLQSKWQRKDGKTTWEVAIKVFDDSFRDGDKAAKAVTLKAGKKVGFMVAYCDNDGGKQRENFIGSEDIKPVNGDRNRGWIDASVFGLLELVKH